MTWVVIVLRTMIIDRGRRLEHVMLKPLTFFTVRRNCAVIKDRACVANVSARQGMVGSSARTALHLR